MARADSFLLTPGRLPWRLAQTSARSRSGIVYDADNRLVCVCDLGNAREIVRMANLFKDCSRENADARGDLCHED